LSIVVVVEVAVDTTVTGGGGAGVAVCDCVAPAEATGTATAPATPRTPTVLIALAKMMLRRFFLIVLVPFRNNVGLVILTIEPRKSAGRSVQGRIQSGYLYPTQHQGEEPPPVRRSGAPTRPSEIPTSDYRSIMWQQSSHRPAVRLQLREEMPAHSGDRIAQLLADHTFEDPLVAWPIEMAQHIVEAAVLEQQHHDMVERVLWCWHFSNELSPVRTDGLGDPAIPSSLSVYFTGVATNDGQLKGN